MCLIFNNPTRPICLSQKQSDFIETVSQSTSPALGATGHLFAVDRWLRVSNQEAGYENCRALQLELQQQQLKLRQGDCSAEQVPPTCSWDQEDLVARLNAVIGQEGSMKSSSPLLLAEDDGDYAASSSDELIDQDSSEHSSYINENLTTINDSPTSDEMSENSKQYQEQRLQLVSDETCDETAQSGDKMFYVDPLVSFLKF